MVTRNVLVTGGSSGIGRAIVLQFARAGDNVWFTYRSGADRALELIDGLDAATASRVLAFEFDQGEWESHRRLAAALPGPVDVLVNNAALGSRTVEKAAGPSVHEHDEALLRVNAVRCG
jgi:NAD(P)-dependent dehydrogenase (short-subunit alcohol dehydrogenase family)